jgi:hypothetical protein
VRHAPPLAACPARGPPLTSRAHGRFRPGGTRRRSDAGGRARPLRLRRLEAGRAAAGAPAGRPLRPPRRAGRVAPALRLPAAANGRSRGAGRRLAPRPRLRRVPRPLHPDGDALRVGLVAGLPPSSGARPRLARRPGVPLPEGRRGGGRDPRRPRLPLAPARDEAGPRNALVGGDLHPRPHPRADGDGRDPGAVPGGRGLVERARVRLLLHPPRPRPRLPRLPPLREALPRRHGAAQRLLPPAAARGAAREAGPRGGRRPPGTSPGRRAGTSSPAPSAAAARHAARPWSPASRSPTRR